MQPNTANFQIAEMTIQVLSDLPINEHTFDRRFEAFRADQLNDDLIQIFHHFSLVEIDESSLGQPFYRKEPWAIYHQPDGWLYLGINSEEVEEKYWKIAKFSHDHSVGHIYHPDSEGFLRGKSGTLTSFPTDQILIARLLADRLGCYLHSAGAIINGAGFLFIGHSEAGKSTTTKMLIHAGESQSSGALKPNVEILCDDRNIVRLRPDGWRVYGSWSHGEIPLVSSASAPLKAICFLEQAPENTLIPLFDPPEIAHRLLACLIKPFVTTDWWERSFDLIEHLTKDIPCYRMQFDKSGEIVNALVNLAA